MLKVNWGDRSADGTKRPLLPHGSVGDGPPTTTTRSPHKQLPPRTRPRSISPPQRSRRQSRFPPRTRPRSRSPEQSIWRRNRSPPRAKDNCRQRQPQRDAQGVRQAPRERWGAANSKHSSRPKCSSSSSSSSFSSSTRQTHGETSATSTADTSPAPDRQRSQATATATTTTATTTTTTSNPPTPEAATAAAEVQEPLADKDRKAATVVKVHDTATIEVDTRSLKRGDKIYGAGLKVRFAQAMINALLRAIRSASGSSA